VSVCVSECVCVCVCVVMGVALCTCVSCTMSPFKLYRVPITGPMFLFKLYQCQ
jgi:hypothetical protein